MIWEMVLSGVTFGYLIFISMRTENPRVGSSILSLGTKKIKGLSGFLANPSFLPFASLPTFVVCLKEPQGRNFAGIAGGGKILTYPMTLCNRMSYIHIHAHRSFQDFLTYTWTCFKIFYTSFFDKHVPFQVYLLINVSVLLAYPSFFVHPWFKMISLNNCISWHTPTVCPMFKGRCNSVWVPLISAQLDCPDCHRDHFLRHRWIMVVQQFPTDTPFQIHQICHFYCLCVTHDYSLPCQNKKPRCQCSATGSLLAF